MGNKPAGNKNQANVILMLAHRGRRWFIIKPALGQRLALNLLGM